jgi:hypothetical protein
MTLKLYSKKRKEWAKVKQLNARPESMKGATLTSRNRGYHEDNIVGKHRTELRMSNVN